MTKAIKEKRFSFKDLKNERLQIPFEFQGNILFNLYDISQKDYNQITEKYKDKQYPVKIVEGGKTVIDVEHEETKRENEKIDKLRTVALLIAMTRGEVDFAEDINEVVNDLEDCGIAIFVELNKAISEVFRFQG